MPSILPGFWEICHELGHEEDIIKDLRLRSYRLQDGPRLIYSLQEHLHLPIPFFLACIQVGELVHDIYQGQLFVPISAI